MCPNYLYDKPSKNSTAIKSPWMSFSLQRSMTDITSKRYLSKSPCLILVYDIRYQAQTVWLIWLEHPCYSKWNYISDEWHGNWENSVSRWVTNLWSYWINIGERSLGWQGRDINKSLINKSSKDMLTINNTRLLSLLNIDIEIYSKILAKRLYVTLPY